MAASLGLAVAISAAADYIAVAGGILAVVAFAGFAVETNQRHTDDNRALQQYSRLRVNAALMTLEELDQRCASISDPDYIEALRMPCFNDTMLSHGVYRAVQPLSRWQRLWAVLA